MLRGIVLVWLMLAGATSAAQNIVVLLDDSGSMGDTMLSNREVAKMDAAKQALQWVLEQLPVEARVGVLALNTEGADGRWIIPLGPNDREQVQQAIRRLQATGGTPLGAGMKAAADALLELRQKQVYGDYRLLIVTDGEAQDSDLVDRYLPEIRQRGLTVDVIGVSMEQNHSLATRVDRYRRADDTPALQQAIQESLAETPLDPQDPQENADFELLNGLSSDVAAALIQGLVQFDNRPLGQSADDSSADGTEVAYSPAAPATGMPDSQLPAEPANQPGGGFSIVTLFILIVVVMAIVKSVVGGKSRRRF